MPLDQAHQPPYRHAEDHRQEHPGPIGERRRNDLTVGEELAAGAGVEGKIARALVRQEEAVAGDHGNKADDEGMHPDALATGASAMVTSGAAACHRTRKLTQSKAASRRRRNERASPASRRRSEAMTIRQPAIEPGVLEDGGKADEDAEQQRKIPVDGAQRVDRDDARCREHAGRQNRDPGRIDAVQGLGDEAHEQADADTERDLFVDATWGRAAPVAGRARLSASLGELPRPSRPADRARLATRAVR